MLPSPANAANGKSQTGVRVLLLAGARQVSGHTEPMYRSQAVWFSTADTRRTDAHSQQLPLPEPLRANEAGTFTEDSVVRRLPEIA